ncbi:MAG: dihydroorotase [Porticoccaceae bacterium]|nr:MAG: dihydroorotase [Porticoccaceae bacterium]
METLTLTRPDDWHVHFRDGAALATTVPAAARVFGRAVAMPNLVPAVTTTAEALAYRERILAHRPPGSRFEPLMTLYLTADTTPAEIQRARESGAVVAAKYYPAGATTHSERGVARIESLYPLLEAMERVDLPLLVHGEVTDPEVDVFDREAVFVERHLAPLVEAFPALRVVLEHVTTEEGVAFVRQARPGVAATITPQHLLFDRNALFSGGLRPHLYCLPLLKRARHRRALLAAATSGNPRFFLGTDSAPHPRSRKESACGCAGCFSHHAPLELYATAFDQVGALHRLEGFASHFGADFYGLPRNSDTVTLVRRPLPLPSTLPLGDELLVPLMAGETLPWRLADGD